MGHSLCCGGTVCVGGIASIGAQPVLGIQPMLGGTACVGEAQPAAVGFRLLFPAVVSTIHAGRAVLV